MATVQTILSHKGTAVVLALGLLPVAASGLAAQAPEPLSPFAVAKAEALLWDHLPCLGCHQLNGEGG
jgi:hypothetical protein